MSKTSNPEFVNTILWYGRKQMMSDFLLFFESVPSLESPVKMPSSIPVSVCSKKQLLIFLSSRTETSKLIFKCFFLEGRHLMHSSFLVGFGVQCINW